MIYADLSEEKKQRLRENSKRYYQQNKEQRKLKHSLWMKNNKEYVRIKQRNNKRLRKEWAISYLGSKCKRCGFDFHPAIYEFHHRIPEEKDRDPSKMLQLSKERLQKELDKCDLLCANCHRFIHHSENY